ncbi:MAG: hypothetical protein J6A05_05035, partial [Oscillospiraceae bacterium]|nr:hypothetical protein [Oscillospiraceae bacterium]
VEHVEAKAATCFEEGNIEYWYCTECGSAWTDELCREVTNLMSVKTPVAHNIEHVAAVAPTCGENGNVEYWFCTECGSAWTDELLRQVTNLKSVILPATEEHSETYFEVVTDPTCSAAGSRNEICTVCFKVINTEVLDALPHSLVKTDITVAPTCEKDGYTVYACENCDYTENGDIIEAEGTCMWLFQGYDGYAYCGGENVATYVCVNCDDTKTVTQNHVFTYKVGYVEGQEPTCTEYGYAVFECLGCSEQETRLVAPVHSYEITDSQNATCTEGGYRVFTCSLCGDSYTEELEPNGHNLNWQYDSTTATCTEAGVEIYSCWNCDEMVEVEVEAYGHDFSIDAETMKNVCSVCGATEDIPAFTDGMTVDATSQYAYYVYNVIAEGYITFTFSTENVNVVIKDLTETYASQYFWGGETWTAEIMADGKYVIGISTNSGEEAITVNTTFEATDVPEMGEVSSKPIVMEGVNYAYTSTGKVWYKLQELMPGNVTITVDGDAVVKYCIYEYGMTVTEDMLTTYTGTFTNEYYADYYFLVESEEQVEIVVNVEAPKGSIDNPLVLENGDNAVSVSGQSWPPFYAAYQSGVNGTLTLTFESATAQIYYGTHPYQMQTPVTNGTTIEITAWTEYYFGITTSDYEPASFTITASFEEAAGPEMPDPDGDIGEIIGSMDVETTDTYGYHDMFTYTAENAGKYTFAVPVGLGFYSKAQYDVWGYAEIDFNSANGGYITVELAAGEEYSFYVGSFTKDEWTIDIYYLAPAHVHTEVEIPAVLPTPSVTGMTAGVKCSECGEIIVEPVQISLTELVNDKEYNTVFRFAAINLSLQEDISVNYKLLVTEGYNNPYVVFVFNGFEYMVTDYAIESSSGRYVFNFDKTFPEFMQENIEAYAYAETAEGEYTMVSYLEYSIMQYSINQLKKNDAALTTVISDVLYLGAMTQIYQYEQGNIPAVGVLVTDAVMAEGYTLTPTAFPTDGIPSDLNVAEVTGDRDTGVDWKAGSLSMGAKTIVNLKFKADNIENLMIKIEIAGETYYYEASKLAIEADTGRYVVAFDMVKSYQFNETITATFERNGEQVGSTMTYSTNSYLCRNYADAKHSDNARNLMKALYTYGVSIKEYFKDII